MESQRSFVLATITAGNLSGRWGKSRAMPQRSGSGGATSIAAVTRQAGFAAAATDAKHPKLWATRTTGR